MLVSQTGYFFLNRLLFSGLYYLPSLVLVKGGLVMKTLISNRGFYLYNNSLDSDNNSFCTDQQPITNLFREGFQVRGQDLIVLPFSFITSEGKLSPSFLFLLVCNFLNCFSRELFLCFLFKLNSRLIHKFF